jgi:hypothetical protein
VGLQHVGGENELNFKPLVHQNVPKKATNNGANVGLSHIDFVWNNGEGMLSICSNTIVLPHFEYVFGRIIKGRKTGHGENCIMMNFIACILHRILLTVIKSRRMRWAGHVVCMGEGRGV